MAEERRLLLANMVRALEHDRHRTVVELHTQAVLKAALSAMVQSVSVILPSDTAGGAGDDHPVAGRPRRPAEERAS